MCDTCGCCTGLLSALLETPRACTKSQWPWQWDPDGAPFDRGYAEWENLEAAPQLLSSWSSLAGTIVDFVNPPRLTPMANRVGEESLDGENCDSQEVSRWPGPGLRSKAAKNNRSRNSVHSCSFDWSQRAKLGRRTLAQIKEFILPSVRSRLYYQVPNPTVKRASRQSGWAPSPRST